MLLLIEVYCLHTFTEFKMRPPQEIYNKFSKKKQVFPLFLLFIYFYLLIYFDHFGLTRKS